MHNKRNACLAVALTFNTRRLWGFNELRLKRILFRLVLWGQFFKCISLVWVAQNSFMNILSDAQSVFHLDEFFAILCCYFICFSCLRSRYFFLLLYRKTCWKRCKQRCGVGVGFLRPLGVGVGFFYPTPEVQLDYFLHRTPMLEILTRTCWNGTISFETFVETENSCCAPWFPLIVSCYKIDDNQTSFISC